MNQCYLKMLNQIWNEGDRLTTRGAAVRSIFGATLLCEDVPLITIRKTAWKTALKEMEWFMSGDSLCPAGILRDVWWKGQLNSIGSLWEGYSEQLRMSTYHDYPNGDMELFDQVDWLRREIKEHPQSRRLVLSTWNPGEMADITKINNNPMTPTSCHGVFTQFQVRNGALYMNTVFRSTDLVLGLPHNLIQYRALQLYFAHHAGVPAAHKFTVYMNDAHIYEAHSEFLDFVVNLQQEVRDYKGQLVYTPTDVEFKASDFTLTEEPEAPLYTKKIIRTL